MFFAILPKISKNNQKSLIFASFLSKMLLRKCSSRHVESSFDNPAKKFPEKTQVFLFNSKKDDEAFVQESFLWILSSVYLDYCFDTPD